MSGAIPLLPPFIMWTGTTLLLLHLLSKGPDSVKNAAFFTVLHLCTVLLIKYFPWVKQPEREVDQSPPASAEMKNKGVMILLPHSPSHRAPAQLFFPLMPYINYLLVLLFILGDSSASELYMPTFRNTVCSFFIGG